MVVAMDEDDGEADWRGWADWFIGALEKHATRPVEQQLVEVARSLAVHSGARR